MKRAVCLFYQREDGKILAVSRKDNHALFGLPGGKVDDGETELEALVREVKEETGLDVPSDVKVVLTQLCKKIKLGGGGDYITTTYFTSKLEGILHTLEPIVIAWVEPKVLLAGPFGPYLHNLFDILGIK